MPLKEQFDILSKGIGFEDVEAFLGYVSIHSDTERALFNGTQIGTMLKMAGHDEKADAWLKYPKMFRSVDMNDLVKEARARLTHPATIKGD